MEYTCKKCKEKYNWIDPSNSNFVVLPNARICPTCRQKTIDKNKFNFSKMQKRKYEIIN